MATIKVKVKVKHPESEQALLVAKIIKQKERAKECYQKADAALARLLEIGLAKDELVRLEDGRRYRLQDNFEQRNLAFHSTAFRRFDISEVKPPKGSKASENGE